MISALTHREVIELTKRILKRRNEEYRFEAIIHGAKIKEDVQVEHGKPLSEKESEAIKRAMEKSSKERIEKAKKAMNGKQK